MPRVNTVLRDAKRRSRSDFANRGRVADAARDGDLAELSDAISVASKLRREMRAPQSRLLAAWSAESRADLESRKRAYDAAYEAGTPWVSDDAYDAFVRVLRRRFPRSGALRDVGGGARGARRERLPIVVGSLDLCRPREVAAWMRGLERESGTRQAEWLVEPKFDGASVLLRYRNRELNRAWKRGEVLDSEGVKESRGEDVTATARLVQGVPARLSPCKLLDASGDYLVRGEVIMHRSLFRKHYLDRPSDLKKVYKTARNMVAGLLNRIDPDRVATDLERCTFIALQLWRQNERGAWVRPPSAQKEWLFLDMLGFTNALNPTRYAPGDATIRKMIASGTRSLRSALPVREVGGSIGSLSVWTKPPTAEEVVARMNAIHGAVDVRCYGIVVQPMQNGFWQRRGDQHQRRPSFMRAIKLEVQDQESYRGVVGEIEWNVSKRGLVKPRLVLATPIDVEGVEVTHATCNNAAFVARWGLRPGRHLKLVRSGDVIPRIVAVYDGRWVPLQVVRPGRAGTPDRMVDGAGIRDGRVAQTMPSKCPSCGTVLRWTTKRGTSERVDLICHNERCPGRHGRAVPAFFTTLGVDDVAKGTVEHLMAAGMDSVPKIMAGATPRRLARLDGYGERKAEIVSRAVAGAMRGVPLAKVMHASGIFAEGGHSLGSTRLQWIVDAAGEGMVRRASVAELRARLSRTGAGGEKGAAGIGVHTLNLFLDSLPEWRAFYATIEQWHTVPTGPRTLAGVAVCFTGFRDDEMASYIESHGGRVAGMSRKISVLFAASTGSLKCRRADELGIEVVAQGDAWRWLKDRGGKQ